MSTTKQEALRLLEGLADNVTWEEIQYRLYVRQKVERGLEQAREGNVLSQEAVEERMGRWLGEP